MPPKRILIATPSAITRSRLIKSVSDHPDMTVIGSAVDLSETYTLAEALEPTVVLVAREFTLVPEWDCMRSLFYALDSRWVNIEPSVGPGGTTSRWEPPSIAVSMSSEQIHAEIEAALSFSRIPSATAPVPTLPGMRSDRLVLIGASTGGVDALMTVLSAFPADCPPTAIVQHTGRGFSESLIRLLDRRSRANVVEAADGMFLRPGTVCVAAGTEAHLRIRPGQTARVSLSAGPLVSGHMPSVDELFRSAVPMGPQVVAAILTGMGRDGAAGLLELRQAGAVTIGQDEQTSVIYGMPGAAWEMGAVEQRLPLPQIGAEIIRACAKGADRRKTRE